MYLRCPKCHHHPMPLEQALPAACPACGVVLAKVAQARADTPTRRRSAPMDGRPSRLANLASLLLHVPERVDVARFWFRAVVLVAFGIWGLRLIALDLRSGEMGSSFLHGPLLVFHEAGHVLLSPFGQWIMVLGGTLAQLLLPALICAAFLLKNRDPFGAAIGLWLFGVSVLDVAPYMYDALEPTLMLLSGQTGEAGGHDWIYLFESMGLRPRAQGIGRLTHTIGALIVLLALAWAGWLLKLQRARLTSRSRSFPS